MDFLQHIFGFNSESPLLFTQFYFWAFFALVYAVLAMIMEVGARGVEARRREGERREARLHLRNIFLMAVSWFFYYKTSGLFLLILVFVTLSDWLIARRIYEAKTAPQKSADFSGTPLGERLEAKGERREARGEKARGEKAMRRAKWWLALSVVIDLGLLCYFKYAYFFTNVVNDLLGTELAVFDLFAYIGNGFSENGRFMVDKIILPVGISFYLFQVMSYTIDVYRGQVKPVKNILDFGFYVSFFPGLVAGPSCAPMSLFPSCINRFV